jgi:hypothetical protein
MEHDGGSLSHSQQPKSHCTPDAAFKTDCRRTSRVIPWEEVLLVISCVTQDWDSFIIAAVNK